MFKEILAVLLLINMTLTAPNPEPKPHCSHDLETGETVCDNTNYCNWTFDWLWNLWGYSCVGRKKRQADSGLGCTWRYVGNEEAGTWVCEH